MVYMLYAVNVMETVLFLVSGESFGGLWMVRETGIEEDLWTTVVRVRG